MKLLTLCVFTARPELAFTSRAFVALAALALGTTIMIIGGCKRPPATPEQKVDAVAKQFVTGTGPALAVAVIKNGELVVKKAYGFADIESKTPATTSSVFDLASLAKQFTGAAILTLAERGELTMDDDVRKYVPEVPAWDPERPIKLKDLSHHVSGLPEFTNAKDQNATTDEMLKWLSEQKEPAFAPGDRWRYTNMNYVVLARVVERVSKKSWAEFLRTEIFAPAKMTTAQVLEKPDGVIAGRVTGYCHGPRICRRDGADIGAANVFASLDDMIAWDQAWRSGVMPEPALRKALDGAWPYALGWGVRDRFMWHDGDWLGASTYIARYLDHDLTIIVLSNQARLDVGDVKRRLAGAFGPAPAKARALREGDGPTGGER